MSPKSQLIVRNGSFRRASDSRRIARFYCRICFTYFSNSSLRADRYQKKRRANILIDRLQCSGVSQRRIARLLNLNPKTVVRKIRFLAAQKREAHEAFLIAEYRDRPLAQVQFDDLETSEHTKCKPLSVALAVDPQTRRILCFQVARMPAKGHLAAISRQKYGYREDERPEKWDEMMRELVPLVRSDCVWSSDENPHYPSHLKKHHPFSVHVQKKGGRGAHTGQGELKKLRFDPLFSLNHTCAMLRANLNRLFRKTWCTTKTKQGLIDHLSLYVHYHNQMLTHPLPVRS